MKRKYRIKEYNRLVWYILSLLKREGQKSNKTNYFEYFFSKIERKYGIKNNRLAWYISFY